MADIDYSKWFAGIFSFFSLLTNVFIYRRTASKDNEDKIYGFKIDAYREMIVEAEKASMTYVMLMNNMKIMYERGKVSDWIKIMLDKMPEFNTKQLELKSIVQKHLLILPKHSVNKYYIFINSVEAFYTSLMGNEVKQCIEQFNIMMPKKNLLMQPE